MEIESVLKHMVSIARKTNHISEQLQVIGLGDEPFFTLYGEAADAIYGLLGEETETFDESETCITLNDPMVSDADCVRILMKVYERSHSHEQ